MDKTVVITGATGKLGSAIARYLAPLGWHMVLTSRAEERCASLAKELRDKGATIYVEALDLLDEDSAESLADRLAAKGVKVTHIINNARSLAALALDSQGLAKPKEFKEEMMIDVISPYRLLMSFVNHAAHALRGVVNIGSQYGEVAPNPQLYGGELTSSPIQYGVAKAALHHLTKELSVRLAPRVRVNCVAFGGFEGRTDIEFQERYAKLSPLGRMLNEDDVGGPVAFLLDDAAAAAVTGHVLVADGGWSVW